MLLIEAHFLVRIEVIRLIFSTSQGTEGYCETVAMNKLLLLGLTLVPRRQGRARLGQGYFELLSNTLLHKIVS